MAQNGPKMAIFGHFGPLWPQGPISSSKYRRKEAYLAIWEAQNGPKSVIFGHFWVILGLQMAKRAYFRPIYRPIWAISGHSGQKGQKWPKMAIFGHFGPFWPLGPNTLDYSNLNMASLATWEAQNGHFWPFLAILGHFGPLGPFWPHTL